VSVECKKTRDPGPSWGAYSAPPDPTAGSWGKGEQRGDVTAGGKKRGGEESGKGEERGRKRRGRKGKGMVLRNENPGYGPA